MSTPFIFYKSAIPPAMCSECGLDAPLVRRTPDEKNPNIEFRIFVCECGHKMVRMTQLDASDAENEKLAERIAGVSKTM